MRHTHESYLTAVKLYYRQYDRLIISTLPYTSLVFGQTTKVARLDLHHPTLA
jgi:hypothetical protein